MFSPKSRKGGDSALSSRMVLSLRSVKWGKALVSKFNPDTVDRVAAAMELGINVRDKVICGFMVSFYRRG